MPKLNIAVLYGGKSTEHEVSVHSAHAVCDILEKKYNITKIFINKKGQWFLQKNCGPAQSDDVEISPVTSAGAQLVCKDGRQINIDVFFPVLHGAMGEDGTMQGLFEILNTPYTGCSVLTSALGMDKELSKLLASFYGVPIVPYIKLQAHINYDMEEIKKAVLALGYPLFVKPMSLGSSVGVTKVDGPETLEAAIKTAFKYERNILVERGIKNPREIFCAVIGEEGDIHTSLCGELVDIKSEFFDYKAKYEDPHGCDIKAPAQIPQDLQDKMRHATSDVFKALRGSGFARVDFLLGEDGKYYFSEINTIPGMSLTSLFPQLWEASGKKYEEVLDSLIRLALKRKAQNDALSLER